MYKPTPKNRNWNRIHARLQDARRLAHKNKVRGQRRAESKGGGVERLHGKRFHRRIVCPEDMSLRSNFTGVVKLLQDMRKFSARQRNERVFLDFKPIRRVDLSGALVVAAELDRWNRLKHGKLHSVDVNKRDPGIRRLLREIGFFDLLDVSSGATEKPAPSDERYVKFMSGTEVDGKGFSLLQEAKLDPFIGVPNSKQLFAAVTEAMTNVSHHAYDLKERRLTLKRWWLSASFNVATREIVILIYDQGRGIPKTVRRYWRDYLRKIAPGSMSDDAKLIREAHGLRRSASRQEHRGLGLERDVRKYIEELNCRGIYCINSLKGQYTVETGAGRDKTVNFERSLNGTLIEWRVMLNETQ